MTYLNFQSYPSVIVIPGRVNKKYYYLEGKKLFYLDFLTFQSSCGNLQIINKAQEKYHCVCDKREINKGKSQGKNTN